MKRNENLLLNFEFLHLSFKSGLLTSSAATAAALEFLMQIREIINLVVKTQSEFHLVDLGRNLCTIKVLKVLFI